MKLRGRNTFSEYSKRRWILHTFLIHVHIQRNTNWLQMTNFNPETVLQELLSPWLYIRAAAWDLSFLPQRAVYYFGDLFHLQACSVTSVCLSRTLKHRKYRRMPSSGMWLRVSLVKNWLYGGTSCIHLQGIENLLAKNIVSIWLTECGMWNRVGIIRTYVSRNISPLSSM
jgi:hypothetical protein